MKIGLISDLHFGVKKGDDAFFDSQIRFLENVYFPRLKASGAKMLFVLGDVFDVRKSISTKILSRASELLPRWFKDFETHIIVGNHDMFYSTTTQTNSVSFLALTSANIFVHERIAKVDKFVLVPWLDETNMKTLKEEILVEDNPEVPYALGHFEIPGFGVPELPGTEDNQIKVEPLLARFKKVFSGHIHSPGVKTIGEREFRYLGAPYQLTRGDKGGQRGAYIFDVETEELEFVENEISAKFVDVVFPEVPDDAFVAGNIVDVQIKSSDANDPDVDSFLEKISKMGLFCPPSLKVNQDAPVEKIEIETDNRTMRDVLYEYVDMRDDFGEDERKVIKTKLAELLSAHEE